MIENGIAKNGLNVSASEAPVLLNIDKLNAIAQGDADIRKALSDSFLVQAETVLGQIDAAMENADKSVLQKLIHKIKGSIAFFAAESLCAESALLEKQSIENRSAEFQNRLAIFAVNIRALMREMTLLEEN